MGKYQIRCMGHCLPTSTCHHEHPASTRGLPKICFPPYLWRSFPLSIGVVALPRSEKSRGWSLDLRLPSQMTTSTLCLLYWLPLPPLGRVQLKHLFLIMQ